MNKIIIKYPFINVLLKELDIERRRKQTLLVVIPISFAILLIFPLIIEGKSFVSTEIIGTYQVAAVLQLRTCEVIVLPDPNHH